MGKKCEKNLIKVKLVKEMNKRMKSNLTEGGNQIVYKKKAHDQLLKTYELLGKLQ